MPNHTAIKKSLLHQCSELIQEKIDTLEKMMASIQDAANNETKSSAGDKYETGRAMMQQEKDKYAIQLAEARRLRARLYQIKSDVTFGQVAFGALVKTSVANYFIAISAGRMEVEGEKFYVISPQAPLAQSILQKSAGDTFTFNDKEQKIIEVF